MSEKRPNQESQSEPAQEVIPENLETKIEAEMPEDFVEPKGKSGKWGEVVENKELGVRYREKVIELSKHRQEETGIKRIRRRELLPPFPKGFCEEKIYGDVRKYYGGLKKFGEVYKFLTNGRWPRHDVCLHFFNLQTGEQREGNVEDFKKEGFYFQEISPKKVAGKFKLIDGGELSYGSKIPDDQDGVFYLHLGDPRIYGRLDYTSPVFIFGDRNKAFSEYKSIAEKQGFYVLGVGELQVPSIRLRAEGIKPLRWCYAELVLVPTKRSLNVLFFETGEEDKKEEK